MGSPAVSQADLVASVRRQAIPLATVEPGQDLADLHWLKDLVRDARVVALGEATHGTHEFFQCRHRLTEFLVTELGFTIVAFEAPWPESQTANDYVLHGTGDPAAALAEMYFWTCNTEEVVELLKWIRRSNAAPNRLPMLTFTGVDTQFTAGAVAELLRYLQGVDPEYAADLEPRLAPLREIDLIHHALPAPTVEVLTEAMQDVAERLREHERAFVDRSSTRAWRIACRCARVLMLVDMQRGARDDTPLRYTLRDRGMAESVGWLLEEGGVQSKVVVWAHNAHVAKDATGLLGDGDEVETLGMNLVRSVDPYAVSIGFFFGQGSFQAMGEEEPNSYVLRDVTIGAPPPGSLDAVLAEVGMPAFALDLRRLDADTAAWFRAPRSTREIGALFESEEAMLRTVVPAASYDALIYVARTTPSRPTPTARRSVQVDT